MARVTLWGSLARQAGAPQEIEIEAATIREVLDRLAERFPGVAPQLERGVSVAVDGTLHRDAWLVPVRPDSAVVLLPRLTGG